MTWTVPCAVGWSRPCCHPRGGLPARRAQPPPLWSTWAPRCLTAFTALLWFARANVYRRVSAAQFNCTCKQHCNRIEQLNRACENPGHQTQPNPRHSYFCTIVQDPLRSWACKATPCTHTCTQPEPRAVMEKATAKKAQTSALSATGLSVSQIHRRCVIGTNPHRPLHVHHGAPCGSPSYLQTKFDAFGCQYSWLHAGAPNQTPCVTFCLVVVSLRGPGQSPALPFACCVGSLCSVGCCGRCSCWCRCRVRGAQWLVCWGCGGCPHPRY